jgi:hypothetical protein
MLIKPPRLPGRSKRSALRSCPSSSAPCRVPFPPGRPGIAWGEGHVGRTLIHEHQAPWVDALQALPPSASSLLLVPFGGRQGLFLKVQPSLRTARLIVATDTLTPWCSSHTSQWRSSVASSLASSWAPLNGVGCRPRGPRIARKRRRGREEDLVSPRAGAAPLVAAEFQGLGRRPPRAQGCHD